MKHLLFLFILSAFYCPRMAAFTPADSTKIKEKKLKTTTVVAQRRVVKADNEKIAYDVTADPSNKTETVLQMLRKVPMVTVDGDDNIKVKGSSSFKVYVDGKPNTMISANPSQILKNYPAEAVAKIEIITDPGAKYDAEGVTGILNIITNKKMYTSGWSLTPSLKLGTEDSTLGLTGMFKHNKLTLSGNFYAGKGEQKHYTINQNYEYLNSTQNHSLAVGTSAVPKYDYQIGALEGSYELNEHNLFSVNMSLFSLGLNFNTNVNTQMFNTAGIKQYSYDLGLDTHNRSTNLNAGFDYQHTTQKEGEILTLSYRYTGSPTLNRSTSTYKELVNYDSTGLINKKIRPDNDSYEHTIQLDYTTPLDKTQTISAGIKGITRHNNSNTKEWDTPYSGIPSNENWQLNAAQSLHYKHTNNIMAAYTEYALKVGKFTSTAGLRFEHDYISVKYVDGKRTDFHKNLDDLLPSIKFSYNLKETEILKLSFNSRIGRPNIEMLSPYVTDNTGIGLTYGNPNLNSERGYNFTLGYGKFGSKFSLNAEITGKFNNNGLTNYDFLDSSNKINSTYDNFLHQRGCDLSIFINWMCTHTTVLNINSQFDYNYYAVKQISARNEGVSANAMINIQQKLPWKLKGSLFAMLASKSPSLQGNTQAFCFHGISFSRSFLSEDRLSITLSANMLVHPHINWEEYTTTTDYCSHTQTKRNASNISISLNWRLGKLQAQVKKAKRTIKNDDVIKKKEDQGSMGNTKIM